MICYIFVKATLLCFRNNKHLTETLFKVMFLTKETDFLRSANYNRIYLSSVYSVHTFKYPAR